MKQSNVNTFVFNLFIALALLLCFSNNGFAQPAENQQMVFEGNLTDSSGNPVNLLNVSLTFYITDANGCYLYGETSNTAGDSSGNINHRIGSAAQVNGSPNSFNHNIFSGIIAGQSVATGSPCTVSENEARYAQVVNNTLNINEKIILGSVPYATNALSLEGKKALDFLLVTDDSNILFKSGNAGQILSKSATGNGLAWINPPTTTTIDSNAYVLKSSNLSDLPDKSVARNNLGLGSFATASTLDLSSASATGTLAAARLPAFTGDVTSTAGSNVLNITSNGIINALGFTPAHATSATQWITTGNKIYYDTGNVGIGTNAPATRLSVNGGVQIGSESAPCAISYAGTLRYVSNNIEFCNGTNWSAFSTSGSGLTSLNGSTFQTQTFANGVSGNSPAFSTANGIHTLNIPLASATGSVTAGLISNSDYVNFNNKITSSSASIIQVLGYVPASSTGLISSTRLPAFTGDVISVSGTNMLTISGTGVTAGTYTKVTVNAKGLVTSGASLTAADITALGFTLAQWTTTANNINYSSGNVGIGTDTPRAKLEISAGNTLTAPLLLNPSSSLLSTQLPGAIEFDGTRLYVTANSGTTPVRQPILTSPKIDLVNEIVIPNDGLQFKNSTNLSPLFLGNSVVIGTVSAPTSMLNIFTDTAGSELIRLDGGRSGYYQSWATDSTPRAKMGLLKNNNNSFKFSDAIDNAFGIKAESIQLGVGINNNNQAALTIDKDGKVGIGRVPSSTGSNAALTVSGIIESVDPSGTGTGGFKFPDGTVQKTSAFTGYERLPSTNTCTTNSSFVNCKAVCSSGKKIISGGCQGSSTNSLVSSFPSSSAEEWQCQWQASSTVGFTAYAICTSM